MNTLDGLYIANQKCDLDDSFKVSFTFQSSDSNNPQVVKNSYSKTVTLIGTKTNNKIFGDAYKLDKVIESSNSNYTNVHFDAKKRVPFTLYTNGDIFEKGYLSLDSINVENNIIKYNCTLYGGLGDFLYNLKYKDNGEEKSLADLQFDFEDESGNTIDESKSLFKWDSEYIKKSWSKLQSGITDNTTYTNITAAPCYNGYHDDFDSNKILVEVTNNYWAIGFVGLYNRTYGFDFKLSSDDIANGWDEYYIDTCKYVMVDTLDRNLSEFETQDLRSNKQRPAIRFTKLVDAMCNPVNNGGYKVVFDNDFFDSTTDLGKYVQNSWVLMNQIDFENDDLYTNAVEKTDYTGLTSTYIGNVTYNAQANVPYSEGWKGNFGFNYNVELLLPSGITNEVLYDCKAKEYDVYNTYVSISYNYFCFSFEYNGVKKVICVQNEENDDALEMYRKTPAYQTLYEIMNNERLNAIARQMDCLESEITFIKRKINTTSRNPNGSVNASFDKDLFVELPIECGRLPKNINIKFNYFNVNLEHSQYGTHSYFNYPMFSNTKNDNVTYLLDSYKLNNLDSEYNGFYKGKNELIQRTNVTKDLLFNNTKSVLDYFMSFSKMFNLRYVMDKTTNTVYVYQRKNYYQDDVIDISNKIDYNKSINIKPTTTEYKTYTFTTNTPETYADKLSKKKNKADFGSKVFSTGYEINTEDNNLFEDNVFNNVIDYTLKSPYINQTYLIPTYNYSLFKDSDTLEKNKYSYVEYAKINDETRPCLHDDEYKAVNIESTLLFFDGFKETFKYAVTDNTYDMLNLNNDKPCYLYTLQDNRVYAPLFSRCLYNGSMGEQMRRVDTTYHFDIPKNVIANQGWGTDVKTIYNTFWENYFEDVYDINAKKVELYVFLPIMATPNELLRKFFYFDNCIWVLEKVTDYTPSDSKPTKCLFVKVKDKNNYLK